MFRAPIRWLVPRHAGKPDGACGVPEPMTEQFFTRSDTMAGTQTQTMLGIALIALGVVGCFIAPAVGCQAGIGILLLVTASWAKNNPLISLQKDHFDLKPAIAAARRLVRYRQIESIEEQGSNKAFVYLKDGKRIALPLAALSEERREDLLTELRRRVKKAGTKA